MKKYRKVLLTVLLCVLMVGCTEHPTEGLEFTQRNGSYAVTGYHGDDVHVVIPAMYNDVPVTVIAEDAFANSEIQSIKVGSNVEIIENGAFAYASLLKTVELPKSLKELGSDWLGRSKGVFYACSNLESVEIKGESCLTTIGMDAFSNCGALSYFEIPSGVAYIGQDAFLRCSSLSTLTIPNTVTFVGYRAFGFLGKNQMINIMGSTDGWAEYYYGDWKSSCNAKIEYN